MAPMAVTVETASPAIQHRRFLSENRSEWSSGAQTAYREVLNELEVWCRRQNSPRGLNSWIAEEAIRQSWS